MHDEVDFLDNCDDFELLEIIAEDAILKQPAYDIFFERNLGFLIEALCYYKLKSGRRRRIKNEYWKQDLNRALAIEALEIAKNKASLFVNRSIKVLEQH